MLELYIDQGTKKSDWSVMGRWHTLIECGTFWREFADRKLELDGYNKHDPEF